MNELTRELYEVLDLIVMEFKTDPQSVACFDLRLVERATRAVERYKHEGQGRDAKANR